MDKIQTVSSILHARYYTYSDRLKTTLAQLKCRTRGVKG